MRKKEKALLIISYHTRLYSTRLGRFELLTLRSAIWCSIQLSYNLIKTTMPETWHGLFRSDGDLNPGYRYQYTSLAGKRLRPLGHRSFYFLSHCAVGYGWINSSLLNPIASMQTRTDGEGFEPPEACTSTVFKTASFDLSDIHPIAFKT